MCLCFSLDCCCYLYCWSSPLSCRWLHSMAAVSTLSENTLCLKIPVPTPILYFSAKCRAIRAWFLADIWQSVLRQTAKFAQNCSENIEPAERVTLATITDCVNATGDWASKSEGCWVSGVALSMKVIGFPSLLSKHPQWTVYCLLRIINYKFLA